MDNWGIIVGLSPMTLSEILVLSEAGGIVLLRYITRFIKQTLPKRAVFIGGPRQVGKTTLALWSYR
jgi:predicted AAA+ superfamily ATPase